MESEMSESDSDFDLDFEDPSDELSDEEIAIAGVLTASDSEWLSSSSDELYQPPPATDSTLETTSSSITVENVAELKSLLLERGEPPQKSQRCLNSNMLSRNCGGETVCGGTRVKAGYTSIMSGLGPLRGIPHDLCWSKHAVRRPRMEPFQPTSEPGPVGIVLEDDPTEVFLKLIQDTLEKFKKFSNQKRLEMNETLPDKKQLRPLDDIDLYSFVATILWMDTRRLSTITEYYEKNPDLADPFLLRLRENSGFGRNQLRNIYKSMRLYDKQECANDGRSDKASASYDPQFKYREILDSFVLSSQKLMNPSRDNALDESMDLFTVDYLNLVSTVRK